MPLRMKHVYLLRGAMLLPKFFPALKKAAEGHFEGLEVELMADGEVNFRLDSGIGIDPNSTEGIRLAAWYQGWICGYLVSEEPNLESN